MKAVILAGGLGTRLSEETQIKPKPMVEVGGMPILWHIMKIYSHYGINDFIICCGFKGYVIKEYFSNYFLHTSDVSLNLRENKMEVHKQSGEPWNITLVDTGAETMTGGRIKKVRNYLDDDEDFCLTYGDGLSDINISDLIAHHKKSGLIATLTAVSPPSRFGTLSLNIKNEVTSFNEKPDEGRLINGGFFVLSPKAVDLIENDLTVWEEEPLETLVANHQLSAFKHKGFWQPMDTLRDKNFLELLWNSGKAPWKKW